MLQFLCRRRNREESAVSSACRDFDDSVCDTTSKSSKLLKWMVDERWDKVFKFLSTQSRDINSNTGICKHSGSESSNDNDKELWGGIDLLNISSTGQNILHLSCMFHPPISIVESILTAAPRVASNLNFEDQYPLHLAAHYGASPEVIGLLMDQFPGALRHQDIHGHTPLHKVCQSYAFHYKSSNLGNFANSAMGVTRKQEDVQDAIQMITRGCPTVANLEDNDNCNALEYALASEHVDLATIKCIQRACSRTWRKALAEAKKVNNVAAIQSTRRVHDDSNCKTSVRNHDSDRSCHSDPGPTSPLKDERKPAKPYFNGSIRSVATASTCEMLDFQTPHSVR